MNRPLTRRAFVATSTLAAAAPAWSAEPHQVLITKAVDPVVVASANGNLSKDADGLTCVARAFKLLTTGADPLDAVLAGVNILELDPEETSVGYGGLPNADGVVQLDASVMHGRLRRAGAVACLEGVRTPSLVARKVMDETDHHLLVGGDAQRFAQAMGFPIEPDLNTEKSRRLWLEWKRRTDPEHYLDPKRRAAAWERAGRAMIAEGLVDPDHFYGTVNCNAVSPKGLIAGATTTSGLAWKIPGRVGDSPILGAGLYVDGRVGAAGSTGRGEANLFSLGSFLVVEGLRAGLDPKDAGMNALKRLVENTIESRLLNPRGKPKFNVFYYILDTAGRYAGVALYELSESGRPNRFALATADGPRTLPAESLFPGKPTD
jgi:N4-(beta-N-acetylglucosaminyl)-L-asparaginase